MGLAIVKEIAVANAMEIAYKFEDNANILTLTKKIKQLIENSSSL